jgi:hypothetical protein
MLHDADLLSTVDPTAVFPKRFFSRTPFDFEK